MHQTSLGPKRCAKCFPERGPNPHPNQLLEVGSQYPNRAEATSTASEWQSWNSARAHAVPCWASPPPLQLLPKHTQRSHTHLQCNAPKRLPASGGSACQAH